MKKKKPHYVNNKEFSQAVFDYVNLINEAKNNNESIPIVPNYIADCFLKIAKGLSNNSNFVGYSTHYKEEMIMDAVENCLKAIQNYDIDKPTRTGTPNAFSYFTQISYYAFIRRITKENRQNNIKSKYIDQSGIEDFYDEGENGEANSLAFIDNLKEKVDKSRIRDEVANDFERELNKKV